jgi:prepilin-type N-terminal cleavage/methylation domain-containing protein
MLHAIRYKLRASRGFTITEVLVVVAVITVLLGVGVGYTQKGGKQIVLFREHSQLTQQILRARSFATQKLRPEQETICGYGIAIASDYKSYTLFKDLPEGGFPGNGILDAGEDRRFPFLKQITRSSYLLREMAFSILAAIGPSQARIRRVSRFSLMQPASG